MDDLKMKLAREQRERAALRRLGTPNPKCANCGENRPHRLEKHHVAGRPYHNTMIIECRNCHSDLSDLQKDHPEQISKIPGFDERLVHFLLGMADAFELLVKTLRDFARQIMEKITTVEEFRS